MCQNDQHMDLSVVCHVYLPELLVFLRDLIISGVRPRPIDLAGQHCLRILKSRKASDLIFLLQKVWVL